MTTQRTVPLALTVEQWADLINRDGQYLGGCCGNISAARDALIEALTYAAIEAPGAYGVIEDARYGEGDPVKTAEAVDRLRIGARLTEENARDLVQTAGTHDGVGDYFFPEREGASPPEEGSPWPAIVAACRELVPDFDAVVA